MHQGIPMTHQGILIPRPQCHNAMISMGSGGPGRTRTFDQGIHYPLCLWVTKLKNPKRFSGGPSNCRPKPSLSRTRSWAIPNGMPVSRRSGRVYGNRTPNHHRAEIPEPQLAALRCSGGHALVTLHRALRAWVRMLSNPKAIFVRPSD
jgi:hypothetical protein